MINHKQLIIATRQSPMALIQAKSIQSQLQQHCPHIKTTLHPLSTRGDDNTQQSLQEIGGKNLFVKELQQALLNNQADIAVNCIKDMSAFPTPGLMLSAVCKRDNPSDAFVSIHYNNVDDIPFNGRIGTSSPRRQSLIKSLRPDCLTLLCRGNVNTRLQKLHNNEYDAIILATAGLYRLGLQEHIRMQFPTDVMIPAIGQGALGIECRSDDMETQQLMKVLNDNTTEQCIEAERAVNQHLKGNCFSPIGAYATMDNNDIILSAMVGSLDGQQIIRSTLTSQGNTPAELGRRSAQKLLNQGANTLLNPQ